MVNRYGNAFLNSWDGNSLVIDEAQSRLVAKQIAAGVKTTDNSFTGMVMGMIKVADEKNPVSQNNKIGLGGYNQGQQTLFFNAVSGKLELGIATKGQIIFEPNSADGTGEDRAFIMSGNYKNSRDYNGAANRYHEPQLTYDSFNPETLSDDGVNQGMLIDLTTPFIQWGNGNFSVSPNGCLIARGGGWIGGWRLNDYQIWHDPAEDGVPNSSTYSGMNSQITDIGGRPVNVFKFNANNGITMKNGAPQKIDLTDNQPSYNPTVPYHHEFLFAGNTNRNPSLHDESFVVTHEGFVKMAEVSIGQTIKNSDGDYPPYNKETDQWNAWMHFRTYIDDDGDSTNVSYASINNTLDPNAYVYQNYSDLQPLSDTNPDANPGRYQHINSLNVCFFSNKHDSFFSNALGWYLDVLHGLSIGDGFYVTNAGKAHVNTLEVGNFNESQIIIEPGVIRTRNRTKPNEREKGGLYINTDTSSSGSTVVSLDLGDFEIEESDGGTWLQAYYDEEAGRTGNHDYWEQSVGMNSTPTNGNPDSLWGGTYWLDDTSAMAPRGWFYSDTGHGDVGIAVTQPGRQLHLSEFAVVKNTSLGEYPQDSVMEYGQDWSPGDSNWQKAIPPTVPYKTYINNLASDPFMEIIGTYFTEMFASENEILKKALEVSWNAHTDNTLGGKIYALVYALIGACVTDQNNPLGQQITALWDAIDSLDDDE